MLYSPAGNMSVAEPKVVVAHREDLWWLLAEACQLEHMIMCQYLFAEWTLKDKDDGLTDEQSEAIERWRGVLRGIAIEEMLHLALVANVMSSIGAAPYFGRPNFPQRSGYFPASIQLDLMPFGEQALRHFLFLERPEGMERQDAEGFVPTAPRRDPLSESEAMPRGQEFLTVGHLYRGIEDGLTRLTHDLGERALFVGSPRAQATPEMFRWPQVVAVTDLDSALRAVGEIIEQGEGARGDWEDAHYGRFLRIWDEYHALRDADPSFEPARPVVAAFTRQPFDLTDPVTVITNPEAHRVAEITSIAYEVLLHLLTRFFTHTDETDEQLGLLISAAFDLMGGVIRPLGHALTQLPVDAAGNGRNAGFAFEMHYLMGNFVPWREPAWALLRERMAFLAHKCTSDPHVVRAAGEQAAALADKLAAHVPAELRSA
ncbi:MAG TPA: ferritin-like protein [Solirubrobacteraceae bacterium]|nr:ferritin-like protein [Solirubrobacteraceae bacterium]